MTPAQLFRACLQEVPAFSLDQSFYGAALYLTQLPSHRTQDFLPTDWLSALVTRAGQPIFTPEILAYLSVSEVDRLASLAESQQVRIPSYRAPQLDQLRAGARDVSNHAATWTLGSCYRWETEPKGVLRLVPQPERFWSFPLSQLRECQDLAQQVAISLVSDERNSQAQQKTS